MKRNLASKILRRVKKIPDRAKFESDEIELRFTRCHLPAVVKTCLKEHRRRFRGKGISLRFRHPVSCPSFRGDCGVILQVLSHLIGNAFRFSHPGGRVEVSLSLQNGRCRGGAPAGGKRYLGIPVRRKGMIVTIRDAGIGISKKDQKNLFLLSSQPTRKIGKGGCDLPTSRFLVESHGGEIWVESGKGKGSAFHIFLPASE